MDLIISQNRKKLAKNFISLPNEKFQVMGAIDVMSLTDSPEAFGLHPNADITYQTRSAGDILSTIVDIQPKDSAGGGGETREEKG